MLKHKIHLLVLLVSQTDNVVFDWYDCNQFNSFFIPIVMLLYCTAPKFMEPYNKRFWNSNRRFVEIFRIAFLNNDIMESEKIVF